MDEEMVKRWNETVRPNDKVYHLGDVVINRKALKTLGRLNGEKVLIKGNHDLCKPQQYLQYFKDIRGSHQFDGMILTHIPIHQDSLARWGLNVHGHLHYQVVRLPLSQIPDRRYYNVSMERINYTPVSLEEVKKHVNNY